MLANPFTPATKEQIYLRMAIVGASGSGKTWTALSIGAQLAALRGGKMAVLDTEGGSSLKYAKLFNFDKLILSKNFSPQEYINAINAAAYHYAVLVVDSFTHAWNGAGGVLDIVDKAGQKMGGNKFAGWATGRPAQNALAEAVLNARIDIIGTMRAKTEWALQPDPRTGKDKPVKIGMAPVQSEDFEYEFDVVAYMDMEHTLTVSKTRCSPLDKVETQDIPFVTETLAAWLLDGDMPVNPAKLAKNVLANEFGQKDFRDFCKSLEINGNGTSKPYLTALGITAADGKFSDYPGLYDDMCKEMRMVYDRLNPQPAPASEDEPAIDPIVQQVAASIPTAQAAESLAHKPGRIPTDAPNWETDRNKLLALADEACEKDWINSTGNAGIAEMEAMLEPQTWADFPTQFQAKLAIRSIYAMRLAQAKNDANKPAELSLGDEIAALQDLAD